MVRSKLLTLVCLNTGRRVCEIAAIADYSFRQDYVVFSWFPGYFSKMEMDLSSWKSEAPRITSIVEEDTQLCPVRAFK